MGGIHGFGLTDKAMADGLPKGKVSSQGMPSLDGYSASEASVNRYLIGASTIKAPSLLSLHVCGHSTDGSPPDRSSRLIGSISVPVHPAVQLFGAEPMNRRLSEETFEYLPP